MQEESNAVIRHDGEIIAYAFMNPYEIGCVERIEDRVESILDDTCSALPAHKSVEVEDIDLPQLPRVKPVTPMRRIMDFVLELDETTDVTVEETEQHTCEELRDIIGNAPIETEDDLFTEEELYKSLASDVTDLAKHTNGDPTERQLQKELEESIRVQSYEAAIESKEEKYKTETWDTT